MQEIRYERVQGGESCTVRVCMNNTQELQSEKSFDLVGTPSATRKLAGLCLKS